MPKIIVAVFLVLTFLCSCSDLNNAAKLKPDDAYKPNLLMLLNRNLMMPLFTATGGLLTITAASISVPLKNITRPYA